MTSGSLESFLRINPCDRNRQTETETKRHKNWPHYVRHPILVNKCNITQMMKHCYEF